MKDLQWVDPYTLYPLMEIRRSASPQFLEYFDMDPYMPNADQLPGAMLLNLGFRSNRLQEEDVPLEKKVLNIVALAQTLNTSFVSLRPLVREVSVNGHNDYAVPVALLHNLLGPQRRSPQPQGEREGWIYYTLTRDPELEEELMQRHMPFVHFLLERITLANVEYEDAFSAATLGFLEAMRRYDVTGGYKFTSFATRRIKGAVGDLRRQADCLTRSERSRISALNRVTDQLTAALGRPPSKEELAAKLALTVDEVNETNGLPSQPRSLELLLADFGLDKERHLADPGLTPEQEAVREETIDALYSQISKLHPLEQVMVDLYFFKGLPEKKIAAAVNVSESRVAQRLASAMETLREGLEAQGIMSPLG